MYSYSLVSLIWSVCAFLSNLRVYFCLKFGFGIFEVIKMLSVIRGVASLVIELSMQDECCVLVRSIDCFLTLSRKGDFIEVSLLVTV